MCSLFCQISHPRIESVHVLPRACFSRYQGVVIYNMADLPIGFGITAASTDDCRRLEATGIVVFHQADVGEFLRDEDSLS